MCKSCILARYKIENQQHNYTINDLAVSRHLKKNLQTYLLQYMGLLVLVHRERLTSWLLGIN